MNRPRGLCWVCYYTPGVRDQYPSTSKFAKKLTDAEYASETLDDLDRLIAQRRPTMPVEGCAGEQRPIEPDDEPMRERPTRGQRQDAAADRTWAQWHIPPDEWELTPDTAPAAIAEAQRAAVLEAVRELGPTATPERVSEVCCLPTWNVRRILGGGP